MTPKDKDKLMEKGYNFLDPYVVTRIGEPEKSTRHTSDYRWIFFKHLETNKSFKTTAFVNERYWDEVIAAGPGTVICNLTVYKPGYIHGRSLPKILRRPYGSSTP